MLTRCVKAYSSQPISSHFATVNSWIVHCSRRSQKSIKAPNFGSSGSFKVIDVDTTEKEKLVTSACSNRQHAHAYLQPFLRKTGQQQ